MTSSANEMRPSSNEPFLEVKPLDDGLDGVEAHARQLLACELHDGLLQQIIGAKMLLEAAAARLNKGQPLTPDDLITVCRYLDAAITEGRRLIGGQRPSIVAE